MIVKNVEYIMKYIYSNELDFSEFCRQCNVTNDILGKILEGKHISYFSYHKICKKLNVRLNKLKTIYN